MMIEISIHKIRYNKNIIKNNLINENIINFDAVSSIFLFQWMMQLLDFSDKFN
jgi:hypothetical protein